jgi:hypothetical protein
MYWLIQTGKMYWLIQTPIQWGKDHSGQKQENSLFPPKQSKEAKRKTLLKFKAAKIVSSFYVLVPGSFVIRSYWKNDEY